MLVWHFFNSKRNFLLAFLIMLWYYFIVMRKWRNGRRSRLKICRGQPRAGSSPATGITEKGYRRCDILFCVIENYYGIKLYPHRKELSSLCGSFLKFCWLFAKNKIIYHTVDGVLLCLDNLSEIIVFFC